MHIKYRPTDWGDVIGNSYMKKSVKSLEYGRPIMFEGPKGCGKTTFAYILAKEFGAPDENITDLNCVYYSKIEDMREIIDDLFKSSIFGNKKVLILDEVHELSIKSQQVFLKPLEKLTENILVVACTTTTSNIKDTLLSRFIRFTVKPLTTTQSKTLIDNISAKENIKLSKSFKAMLIEKSDGIPRLLLTGLAKLRNVKDEDEAKYLLELNTIDESEDLFNFYKLLVHPKTDWRNVIPKLKNLLKTEKPNSVRIGLMNIAGARMISDYYNPTEAEQLNHLFTCLHTALGFPEKSCLISGLHKFLMR